MILTEDAYLAHYGILRKSGRYPWGSGATQSARNRDFLGVIDDLKRQGMSDTQIAEGFHTKEHPFNTSNLRAARAIAINEQKQSKINQAERFKEKGLSNVAIGKRMGINESSVRSLLEPGAKDKANILLATANMLRSEVEKKGLIDIGSGVELSPQLGISSTKLKTAVAVLQEEGYKVHYVKVPQQTSPGNFTSVKVLSNPGVSYSEVYRNRGNIKLITNFSEDGGRSYTGGFKTPISIASSRIGINYAEHGGAKADGVIYVRRNVDDVSIGEARYAQVRISVDGTHYLKGMAVYKDGLPPGQDLVFNTNKANTGIKTDAMKKQSDDPQLPFGSVVRQRLAIGADGKEYVTSAMNIVNEEGDWAKWSKNLPAQMLSKQNPTLAQTQLDFTFDRRDTELKNLLALTNPAVKKKLLETYADETDSAAVHLKAAHLPRQATQVLLPVTSVKPTEIYAPNFNTGERVVLVRFPHSGTFEIPELTVNNRNPEAKALMGSNPKDAVGINHKVAERLSGADFDGDTALVIPNDRGLVKSTPALDGLKNFDPKSAYPPYDGMRTIDGGVYNAATKQVTYPGRMSSRKQYEMGNVTNLIADMSIRGAGFSEIARAVRHSMVVIDAEKHNLDYKASAKDNGIAALKAEYQTSARPGSKPGASTLITRASSETHVAKRKPRPADQGGPIDKATGKKVFVYTGESYVNAKGKTVPNTFKSVKLAETHDAHTLSSGTTIETIYADHSNRLKSLANMARKEAVAIKTMPANKASKTVYSSEVASLNAKLNVALRNAPLERNAQALASEVVAVKKAANPNLEAADLKKIRTQAINEMRTRTGAKKQRIEITPQEWNAIQAGAISNDKLQKILNNTDLENIRKLATPRTNVPMGATQLARARTMLDSGYPQSEVARTMGVSLSTLNSNLQGGGG